MQDDMDILNGQFTVISKNNHGMLNGVDRKKTNKQDRII